MRIIRKKLLLFLLRRSYDRLPLLEMEAIISISPLPLSHPSSSIPLAPTTCNLVSHVPSSSSLENPISATHCCTVHAYRSVFSLQIGASALLTAEMEVGDLILAAFKSKLSQHSSRIDPAKLTSLTLVRVRWALFPHRLQSPPPRRVQSHAKLNLCLIPACNIQKSRLLL